MPWPGQAGFKEDIWEAVATAAEDSVFAFAGGGTSEE